MLQAGTAPVILETVGSVSGLQKGDLSGNFYIQVGAFASQDNAKRLVSGLKSRGYGARSYFAEDVGFWRVQIGPYPSLNKAESITQGLSAEFPTGFVVAE
jgi:rare lipoprotein A